MYTYTKYHTYYIMSSLEHMHSGELMFFDNELNCHMPYVQAHCHSKKTQREVLNTLICSVTDESGG